jgi:hypothetical protein
MKAHVEHLEGRWLPSRFRYALFRLAAFVILRKVAARHPSSSERRHVFVIDRDQNPIESFTLSLFLVVWISACAAVALPHRHALNAIPAAGWFVILLFLTPVAIQIVLYIIAGLRAALRRAGVPLADANYEIQTAAFLLLMVAAATLASLSRRPALSALGWIWLALLGFNCVAAIVMRLLATSVSAVEARLREEPSEL